MVHSLDPSFATDEKITLQRVRPIAFLLHFACIATQRIVELAALRRSLVLRLQTLDEEKRNLRVQHTQREEALKAELELNLSSSLSVVDGRCNKARESVQNIASLSTKYTALLKGEVDCVSPKPRSCSKHCRSGSIRGKWRLGCAVSRVSRNDGKGETTYSVKDYDGELRLPNKR